MPPSDSHLDDGHHEDRDDQRYDFSNCSLSQPEYYDTWERAPLPDKLPIPPPSDSHLLQLTPGRSFSRMTDYRRWGFIFLRLMTTSSLLMDNDNDNDIMVDVQVTDATGEKAPTSSKGSTAHSDRIRARCKWEIRGKSKV